jgi:hypothetical protein
MKTQATNTQMLNWIYSFDMSTNYEGLDKMKRFKDLYYVDMIALTPQEFLQTLSHNELLDIMDDMRSKSGISNIMNIVLDQVSNNREEKLNLLGI